MAVKGFYGGRSLGVSDLALPAREVAKTANYTVLPKDNGTLFTNTGASGAVTFTLPAVAAKLVYEFYVVADQTVTITATSNVIVTTNNAAGTSVAFSTNNQKIGSHVRLFANEAGTKWYTRLYTPNTMTVS